MKKVEPSGFTYQLPNGSEIILASKDWAMCYQLNGIVYVPHRSRDQRGKFAFPGIKKGENGITIEALIAAGAKPTQEYLYV